MLIKETITCKQRMFLLFVFKQQHFLQFRVYTYTTNKPGDFLALLPNASDSRTKSITALVIFLLSLNMSLKVHLWSPDI